MRFWYGISFVALFVAGVTAVAGLVTGGDSAFPVVMFVAFLVASLSAGVGLFAGE